jgi:cytoskeletal protein RodZ
MQIDKKIEQIEEKKKKLEEEKTKLEAKLSKKDSTEKKKKKLLIWLVVIGIISIFIFPVGVILFLGIQKPLWKYLGNSKLFKVFSKKEKNKKPI